MTTITKKFIRKKMALPVIMTISALLSASLLNGCGQTDVSPRTEIRNLRAKLRSYEGAPPIIPHQIIKESDESCRYCHERGALFEADAKVMGKEGARAKLIPHGEYPNCIQCHIIRQTDELFVVNNFEPYRVRGKSHKEVIKEREAAAPSTSGDGGNTEAGDSEEDEAEPPEIPHLMQNHDLCAACHLSKTSYPNLRPLHGKREDCRGCHYPSDAMDPYLNEE